ncbi:hypothetical protein Lsed01_01158 [Demequina sediminis]|uniref:DUF4260 family protein n=1 Tax=Demequina sediminis TaxID=1930058 RepID=A0ABP9WFX4_9MICO|nr:DUF4260 domain-containing protein [Demequina sediminis]BDZ61341.1 hypothetical protein GCM10025873_11320 [Demequina sediminis]
MNPVRWQRLEGAACAVLALIGAAALGAWWWPLALFLAFDLSALGYLRDPREGAFVYNLVHSYWGPAALAGWAIAIGAWGAPGSQTPVLVVAAAWLFHVGVDRALGYGLKHDDDFQHTHLGWIGRASARDK